MYVTKYVHTYMFIPKYAHTYMYVLWKRDLRQKPYFRYGELETSLINLVVKGNKDPTEATIEQATFEQGTFEEATTSTDASLASAVTPSIVVHNTTLNPMTELQEYQRQFFFLKVYLDA